MWVSRRQAQFFKKQDQLKVDDMIVRLVSLSRGVTNDITHSSINLAFSQSPVQYLAHDACGRNI